MQLSVGIPPGPRTLEHAQLAQELGYDRVWLYDSAALYEDIWIWMARLAEHTDLDLGTAVLVPNLRHVMTTASAIATVERMAPGRLACGFGTGATARWVLNKPALCWATTQRYLEQLRALLRGEVVEVDGERCQMIHHPDFASGRPIDTPLLVSALGPKGKGIVEELCADGHHRRLHRHGRRRRRRPAPRADGRGHRARRRRGHDQRARRRRARALVRRALPRRVAGVPRRAGGHARGRDLAGQPRSGTPRGRAAPRGARGSRHPRDAARRRRARARRRRARRPPDGSAPPTRSINAPSTSQPRAPTT